MGRLDEIKARFDAEPDWGVYDGALCRQDLAAILDEFSALRADLARVTAERDAAVTVIRDICAHCGWIAHSPTCRGIDCPIGPWLPPQTQQEETEQIAKSMRESPIRTDKEAARVFLSRLSMYDENGQLRDDPPHNYIGEEAVGPQEVQDESN